LAASILELAMNKEEARSVFEEALAQHSPGYGSYLLFKLLGLECTVNDGVCTAHAPVRGFLSNPHGVVHGGILATIMDMTMGQLLLSHYGSGGATLEMKVQYLKSVASGALRCEARFLKAGRSIAFMEARLFDDAGDVAASATATWKPQSKKAG
jgi:uncharacterized protein (TIGR00369 family)